MGLFDKIKTAYEQNQGQKEQERLWVRNHQGTKAICEFVTALYKKGQPIYRWIKENKKAACVTIYEDRVSICYKAGVNQETAKFNEYEIASYTFVQMYQWYEMNVSEGYSILSSKNARKELEQCIFEAVRELPHINGDTYMGFGVKLFQ